LLGFFFFICLELDSSRSIFAGDILGSYNLTSSMFAVIKSLNSARLSNLSSKDNLEVDFEFWIKSLQTFTRNSILSIWIIRTSSLTDYCEYRKT
jgi:hypothetical protein